MTARGGVQLQHKNSSFRFRIVPTFNALDKPDPSARPNLDRLLTIYGRKPVLEALEDPAINPARLHLADSNRTHGIIAQIEAAAAARQVDVRRHDRQALSRISKNGRQDQGVALDIECPRFDNLSHHLKQHSGRQRLLVLDGITNPQNVGMIIRSAVAAGIDGIVIPKRGVAALGPLVIKASSGTIFRAPLLTCSDIEHALNELRAHQVALVTLAGDAKESLFDYQPAERVAMILGSETDGVSMMTQAQTDHTLRIPMESNVESLNVAVTAALVSYHLRHGLTPD